MDPHWLQTSASAPTGEAANLLALPPPVGFRSHAVARCVTIPMALPTYARLCEESGAENNVALVALCAGTKMAQNYTVLLQKRERERERRSQGEDLTKSLHVWLACVLVSSSSPPIRGSPRLTSALQRSNGPRPRARPFGLHRVGALRIVL